MNSFEITCEVWTPEDRAMRDEVFSYCMDNGIGVLSQQLSERKYRFQFNSIPGVTNYDGWAELRDYVKVKFEEMETNGQRSSSRSS